MTIGLVIILAAIFIVPFIFKKVERNLEYFLFVMGILATLISSTLSFDLCIEILENKLLYFITGAVLVAGLIFKYSAQKISMAINYIIQKLNLHLFLFLVIVLLGLFSSLITAIIASLILVEIVLALPYNRDVKIKLTIISCFSIGLGAVLTPIGEPLATIVVSSLNENFCYLVSTIGIYVIPGILALGVFGALYICHCISSNKGDISCESSSLVCESSNLVCESSSLVCESSSLVCPEPTETLSDVFIRSIKIFIFVIALELLGTGFKPLIETYIINLNSMILYWINILSAVLDNATIAAAEISPSMTVQQIQAILMGLLISGGMLIPGNIPNIISAGKLQIKSREWAKFGLPLGFVLLLVYFVILFIV